MSLKQPFEIVLKPQNWTDIAHPFQFDVLLKDILQTTGTMSDSIDIQYWQYDSTTYSPAEIYNAALDSIVYETDTIKSTQRFDGYTIYNHSVNPITLKIPPIPLSLSNNYTSSQINSNRSYERWDITFSWRDKNDGIHSLFKNIRCGYIKQIADERILGPLPPSFSKIKIGIHDSLKNRLCGYAIENSLKEGGTVFEVTMMNNSEKDAVIEYYLGKLTNLPEGFQAKVFNPEKMVYEGCNEQVKSDVPLKINSVKNRLLVVGTDHYFSKVLQMITPFHLSFLNVYLNPFRGTLQLRYSIPDKIKEVQFTMYNVMGKTLWAHKIKDNLTPGTHTLIYNTNSSEKSSFRLATGIYILRLTAINNSNQLIFGGNKRIMFIK